MTQDQHDGEDERLQALDRYDILDTPPEETFDRITRLVSRLFGVPIATITLIDAHRQWFKSRRGLDLSETARGPALCNVAIREGKPLVVPDTRLDPRFAENPFVTGEPFIRFYAGAPLHTPDGQNIGTLCAMDTKPHDPDPGLIEALTDLARIVIDELELRTLLAADPLTGALSRRAFREQGARAHSLSQRHRHDLSCIALDIDRLDALTETGMGDATILSVSGALKRALRKSDVLARMGGGEFVALLPHTGRASALKVAEKLRTAVARARGATVDATISVGVAIADRTTHDLASLLERAQSALAAARAEGGNRSAEWQPPAETGAQNLRRRVFKAGKVVFNGGRSTIDCTVRSLSDEGASFDLISSAGIPEEFKLQIDADGMSRLCRVVAKRDRHLEVKFA